MTAAAKTIAEPRAAKTSGLLERVGDNGLVVAIVLAGAVLPVAAINRMISTDGWLALVAGRSIVGDGLPSTNTLTILGAGRPWVDQQWLGQVVLYGAERLGGLPLVLFGHVALTFAALAIAAAVATRRGARPEAVGLVTIVALLPFMIATFGVRTQTLVYVPFVVLLAAVTSRKPLTWRRTLVLVALLAVWANLHGSVLVAAALVSLRGLLEARSLGWREPRSWTLVVAPWAALFATPYALDVPDYYAQTILNPGFGQLAQWQPTTLSAVSAPLFLLAFGFVWILARDRDAYSTYEKVAGGALLVLALLAMRNWVWFTLFAVMFLPRGVTGSWQLRSSVGIRRVNAAVALVAAAALAATIAATASRPASWYEAEFPPAAADAVAAAANRRPSATVYATERYADWLLWKLPLLAGRLAYDARFELLEEDELEAIALFRASPVFLEDTLRRHEIVVLDRTTERRVTAELAQQTDELFGGRRIVVAVRR
ncbi:MAG TPA: hypothetical protein VLB86_13405 [Gaiellaceae bacterium]|nr:hypothetical protein [Gaiellaceae bacterium]